MEIDVVHQPSGRRYIVTVNGAEAGEASYVERDNELLITHTFVDPRFRNQGLGAVLVKRAIDDIITTSESMLSTTPVGSTPWAPSFGSLTESLVRFCLQLHMMV
jgi:predicted GNAT family acetyltransferase